MHDVLFVQVVESKQDLFDYRCSICDVELSIWLCLQSLLEVATSHKLRYAVVVIITLHQLEYASDMWVVCRTKYLELVFDERLGMIAVRTNLIVQLDSARHPSANVPTAVNAAKVATTDLKLGHVMIFKPFYLLLLHVVLEANVVNLKCRANSLFVLRAISVAPCR